MGLKVVVAFVVVGGIVSGVVVASVVEGGIVLVVVVDFVVEGGIVSGVVGIVDKYPVGFGGVVEHVPGGALSSVTHDLVLGSKTKS